MLNVVKKLFSSQFLQSTAVYSVTSFGASFLQYLLVTILARSLSLSAYGDYMAALSYIGIMSVPLGALQTFMTKKVSQVEITRRPAATTQLLYQLKDLFINHWLSVSICFSGMTLILIHWSNLWLSSSFFVMATVVLSLFLTISMSILQANKLFYASGMLLILGAFFKLVFGGSWVWLTAAMPVFYVIMLLTQLLAIVCGIWMMMNRGLLGKWSSIKTTPVLHAATYLRRKSVYLPALVTFGVVGLSSIDLIILKKVADADQLGLYAGLALLGKIVTYIAGPFSIVAYSYFAGVDSRATKNRVLLMSSALVMGLGLSATIGYALVPQLVIRLILGEQFLSLTSLLWLAGIYGAFYSLVYLWSFYWLAQSSLHSLAVVIGIFCQALALYLFHDTFQQIILASTLVYLVLLGYYLSQFLFQVYHSRSYRLRNGDNDGKYFSNS
jgi:O-antigen/teichoic acid export membrane protein